MGGAGDCFGAGGVCAFDETEDTSGWAASAAEATIPLAKRRRDVRAAAFEQEYLGFIRL